MMEKARQRRQKFVILNGLINNDEDPHVLSVDVQDHGVAAVEEEDVPDYHDVEGRDEVVEVVLVLGEVVVDVHDEEVDGGRDEEVDGVLGKVVEEHVHDYHDVEGVLEEVGEGVCDACLHDEEEGVHDEVEEFHDEVEGELHDQDEYEEEEVAHDKVDAEFGPCEDSGL